jgi:Dna[CI] antecedent, DciA
VGDLADRWPAAVGEAIARNAWPSRVGRDGTVHVNTTDSAWAFELAQQATAIAGRLGVPAVRFAPGPLAGGEDARPPAGVALPSAEQSRAATEIAAAIEDESLREKVQKAVSLGLARGCRDSPV